MAPSASKSKSKPDKKRKHATFKPELVPYKVTVLKPNPKYDPIVVSYPRGLPFALQKANLDKPHNYAEPKFTWNKLKPNSDRGRRLIGEDDTCVYAAESSGRPDGRLLQHYVLVLNKTKRTMTLVPTAEGKRVFALEQWVKAYEPDVAAAASAAVGGTSNDDNKALPTAKDRVNMLVESFGSKKKQKVMASRKANVVNINKVVGAGDVMMDSVVGQKGAISETNREMLLDGSKVVDTIDAALLQARRKVMPPFDETATEPNQVFSPQLMAESNAWAQVSRIVDKVIKSAQEESENTAPSDWIINLLGRGGKSKKTYIPDSISESLQNLDLHKKSHHSRVKAIFFLFLLMRFQHKISNRKRINGDYNECLRQTRTPAEVGARLLELFMIPMDSGGESGYACTPSHLDKLHTYILVLYVIGSGKDMKVASVNQLLKDIKLDEKRGVMIYREAGFTVKKSGSGDVGVTLTVPLTFPPPRRGKRS